MKKHGTRAGRVWSYRNLVSLLAFLVTALVIGVIIYAYGKNNSIHPSDVCIRYEIVTNSGKSIPIGTRACTISLETVNSEAEREQGLSNRSSMPANRGMLFVFDSIGQQCIWMKGMHFNLDIVWLNAQGNVIKLAENLAPSTYPTSYCAENTYYVIEVNAHVAKSAELTMGSHVNL